METAVPPGHSPDEAGLAQDLTELRALLESGRSRVPESRTPPAGKMVGTYGPSRSLDRQRAWLREHAREYPGCWLAVFEDRLVAAGPDFGEVLDKVRSRPGCEEAILFFTPKG